MIKAFLTETYSTFNQYLFQKIFLFDTVFNKINKHWHGYFQPFQSPLYKHINTGLRSCGAKQVLPCLTAVLGPALPAHYASILPPSPNLSP